MHKLAAFVLAALVIGGCGAIEQTTTTEATTTTAPPQTAPVTEAQAAPESEAPCLTGDRPFAREGIISAFGGANGDATMISGIRWVSHPGCERVMIDLLTADGAPAGAIDPVGVDYEAVTGVIRVNLPDAIAKSAISDSLFDGDLISRAFVVDVGDGKLAIDVHTVPGSTIALRAFEVDSPSRIVIDIRPDADAAAVAGATLGDEVVLISPIAGPTTGSIPVRGYMKARTEELAVRVVGANEVVQETTLQLPGDTGLWREFLTTLSGVPAGVFTVEVVTSGSNPAVQVEIDTSDRSLPSPPEV